MRRIAGAALLAFAAVGSLAPAHAAGERTRSYEQSSPLRTVTFDVDAGWIDVRPGAKPHLVVAERWAKHRPTVDLRRNGDALTVEARCPDRPEGECSVDLALTLDDEVELNAELGAGDIVVTGVRTSRVSARTGAGEVTVDVTALAEVVAHSGAGDVDVRVPDGVYDLRLRSGAGDTRVRGVENDSSASRRISATTGAGDVVVRVSDGSPIAKRAGRSGAGDAVVVREGEDGRDGADGRDGGGSAGAAIVGIALVFTAVAGAWIIRAARSRVRRG